MLGAGVIPFGGVTTPGATVPNAAYLSSTDIGNTTNTNAFNLSTAVNATGGNLLVVCISLITAQYNTYPDVVTFDGVAMTAYSHQTDSNATSTFMYYLQNPNQTTGNVVVQENSSSIYANFVTAKAYLFSGVNATTPFQGNAGTGASGTIAPALATTGKVVLCGVSTTAFQTGHTTMSSLTNDFDTFLSGNGEQVTGHLGLTSSATTTMTITANPSYCYNSAILAAIQ